MHLLKIATSFKNLNVGYQIPLKILVRYRIARQTFNLLVRYRTVRQRLSPTMAQSDIAHYKCPPMYVNTKVPER
jgi:hypothetical protein